MLYRMVIMCRTNLALGNGALQGELGSILSSGMKARIDHEVTGALIWDAFLFMEVLEGHPDHLERVWETVCADPRNSDCRRLDIRPVTRRQFKTWSVGGQRAGSAQSPFIKRIQTIVPAAEEVCVHIDDVLARGPLAESPMLERAALRG